MFPQSKLTLALVSHAFDQMSGGKKEKTKEIFLMLSYFIF